MALFGSDPRDSEISFLRAQVKFLQEQLVMIADSSAAARLLPRAERKDGTGKARTNWRMQEDRPSATESELAAQGADRAASSRLAFVDSRQP